jgi:Protein of unknown function (DUF4239)
MSALGLSLITFVCIFGATLLSMYLRTVLPKQHLSQDSKDAVRLSMGVIGTMAALVLGLLIASAKSSFDTKNSQIKEMTSHIILLDQLLAQYGPETRAARQILRLGTGSMADRIWREGDLKTTTAFSVSGEAEEFLRKIEQLAPQTESQRAFQARAIKTVTDLAQTRLLLYTQSDKSIPLPFLVLLIFWLAIIFASFSLFVSPNPIVVAAFFVCAFSASGAVFLIFELDRPFSGLMNISDAPLRHALAPL